MNILKAQEILDYWFPKNGSPDYNKWFIKSQDYDEEIKEKFGDLLKEAEKGKGYGWLVSKDSYIAYIILMDQFSRHIYRGSGDAFKNDIGVMIFTELGFELYKDDLVNYELMFAFMPYMHSENIGYQRKGEVYFHRHMELYDRYGPRCISLIGIDGIKEQTDDLNIKQNDKDYEMLKSMKSHIEGHRKVILCYGRFPKRNEVLGRKPTFHEEQYMNREEVKKRPY